MGGVGAILLGGPLIEEKPLSLSLHNLNAYITNHIGYLFLWSMLGVILGILRGKIAPKDGTWTVWGLKLEKPNGRLVVSLFMTFFLFCSIIIAIKDPTSRLEVIVVWLYILFGVLCYATAFFFSFKVLK
jgi:hypothetical protein